MPKRLVVANWKMNFNVSQASVFMHRLDKKVTFKKDVEVVICPSFVALQPLYKDINQDKFQLGAQNMHHADHGTFTGEISGQMLTGLAKYVIIGHSERRYQFNESDVTVARKVSAAVRHRLIPILCVGDKIADRQEGLARAVVNDQLSAGLAFLTANEVMNIVIAYEPVWAISSGDGHGHTAKPEDAAVMAASIRQTIKDLYGKTAASKVKVLYGGSVTPENTGVFLGVKGVDGFLVGGASLNYEQFAQIIKTTQKQK
jgi:triosephosphate isomerase